MLIFKSLILQGDSGGPLVGLSSEGIVEIIGTYIKVDCLHFSENDRCLFTFLKGLSAGEWTALSKMLQDLTPMYSNTSTLSRESSHPEIAVRVSK